MPWELVYAYGCTTNTSNGTYVTSLGWLNIKTLRSHVDLLQNFLAHMPDL